MEKTTKGKCLYSKLPYYKNFLTIGAYFFNLIQATIAKTFHAQLGSNFLILTSWNSFKNQDGISWNELQLIWAAKLGSTGFFNQIRK